MTTKLHRYVCFILTLTLILSISGCSSSINSTDSASDKIQIVCTIFPQYDFARNIAGDQADVKLLLSPGAEIHTFDPSPADMLEIEKSNLFIYTGDEMEPWASTLIKSSSGNFFALDVSENITLIKTGEHEHEHSDENEHELEGHEHTSDPHIWTSPLNAKIMCESIAESLISLDPDGAETYKSNLQAYVSKLDKLDSALKNTIENCKRTKLIFGGRFAFLYLTHDYDLEYISAYDSCSAETEPSAAAVAKLIDVIKNEDIPVIYYEELVDPKLSLEISSTTGAEALLLHSCHNLSASERDAGEDYISIMTQNIENIRKGLN